jgi:creatinine amidohydrolase
MTWEEVSAVGPDSLLVVPLGATEQHGPHLGLGSDNSVAEHLALEMAKARSDIVVAPTLNYGSSGEHQGFGGTLSVGQQALETLLVELARSADLYKGVFFLSGHGGNAAPMVRARDALVREGRKIGAWWPTMDSLQTVVGPSVPDAHAGWVETSMLMWISPSMVRTGKLEAGNTRPLPEISRALASGGVSSVSSNGVLGDPTLSSAALGSQIIGALTKDLISVVDEIWRVEPK